MELAAKGTKPATTATTYYGGHDELDLVAGKTFKIETTPGGTEVLAATVPTGKKWRVVVGVEIVETDA